MAEAAKRGRTNAAMSPRRIASDLVGRSGSLRRCSSSAESKAASKLTAIFVGFSTPGAFATYPLAPNSPERIR